MKSERLRNLVIALPVMGSMARSGRLAVSFVWVILGIPTPLAPAAHAQTRPAIELERAISKEQVDGDLKTAMAVYQKIGGDQSAPRDVRAKASLHLAGCYQRLSQMQCGHRSMNGSCATSPSSGLTRTWRAIDYAEMDRAAHAQAKHLNAA